VTPRPRVQGLKSRAQRSDERWSMDVTHIPCGVDGWGHLTAVIDCHDREIAGFEFALRGRAKEAERALEEACLARFGTLRPDGPTPVVRSDNGLIFQSRRFRAACRDYRLRQEFITPYTPVTRRAAKIPDSPGSLLQRVDHLLDDRVGPRTHFVVACILNRMRYEDPSYFG